VNGNNGRIADLRCSLHQGPKLGQSVTHSGFTNGGFQKFGERSPKGTETSMVAA